MKKVFVIIFAFILCVFLSVVVMYIFKICPPSGPWPTPPWCQAGYEVFQYEVNVMPKYLNQVKAVNMFDTWGRNYNMNMVENTRNNIVSSFDRVARLSASEIYVHDFDRAVYRDKFDFVSLSYDLVDEIFLNDMRDESMTEKDLKRIVAAAHERGLQVGIKRNIAFVNIGKYIIDGLKGGISESVVQDYNRFNQAHTEEWVRDYFAKWQNRLVEKGRLYQEVGVDIMSVSPSFQEPTFAGHETLANELWKDLLSQVRQVFKGRIAVDFNVYGLVDGRNGGEDWTKYDYYKNADIIEVKLYKILEKYQNKSETLDKQMERMIADIDRQAGKLGIKVSVFFAPSSYRDGIYKGPVEVLDINNVTVKSLEADYAEQVNSFDVFFKSINKTSNVVRVNVANFAWDDALDPVVKPRLSVAAGFRNKPSEQVVKAWYGYKGE